MPEKESGRNTIEDLSPEAQEVFEQGAEKLRQGNLPDATEFLQKHPEMQEQASIIRETRKKLISKFAQALTPEDREPIVGQFQHLVEVAEAVNAEDNTVPIDLPGLKTDLQRLKNQLNN